VVVALLAISPFIALFVLAATVSLLFLVPLGGLLVVPILMFGVVMAEWIVDE
jgi:hypothetical protein